MTGAPGGAIVYVRDDTSGTLTALRDTSYRDGTVLRAPAAVSAADVLWRARFDPASGRVHEVITTAAPALWFVSKAEPDAQPAAMNLIAFTTRHFPAGKVIDDSTFIPLPIRSDEQAGAIRWWPASAQIHQVYVAPQQRRRGIGRALVYAAAAFVMVRGGEQRLWTNGDRTDLGEALATGLGHMERVRRRSSVVAPMTPEPDTAGVPARNLRPSA